MLDQELKQAYKKIVPSSELEHRILNMQVRPQSTSARLLRFAKPLATMAACAVFLLGGLMIASHWKQMDQCNILLRDGTALTDSTVLITPDAVDETIAAMPRVASQDPVAHSLVPTTVSFELHISSKKEVLLSTNVGILYMVTKEDEEELVTDVGQHWICREDGDQVTVRWVIPVSDKDSVYQMSVGQNEIVCITYCAQTDEYFISRKDAES